MICADKWEYTLLTDCGCVRSENQDAIFGGFRDETGMFILCDGMGGHLFGSQASNFIIQCYRDWWNNIKSDLDFLQLLDSAKEVLYYVNMSLYKKGKEVGNICGSTLELLFLRNDLWGIIHVGDSRIYQISEKKLFLLTTDHTWKNSQLRKESLSEQEIDNSPLCDKLLQAVGGDMQIYPFVRMGQNKQAKYFLCSDGVYKVIGDRKMKQLILNKHGDCISQMKKEIINHGAPDNFSAIMIDTKN